MRSCTITFKIKDYFPKIDSIPFEEFFCLFINGDFNEKIPLIEKDFNICKHQINNVNTDLKYKIHIVNINDGSLIGICEIVIPYAIISQIETPGTFIKEQQLKLFIDLKTKRKLFGTLLSSGDIYLYISAEVFVNIQNNFEKKKKNINKNKNGYKKEFNVINLYENNNKKKFRVIKTDKDNLRNECKTYTCLKHIKNSSINSAITNDNFYAPSSGERKKEVQNNKQSNLLELDLNNNLTFDNIDSNKKNIKKQNQKVKKVNTQKKKLTILDLMEQKIKNKKELNNKKNNNFNKFNKSSSPRGIKNLNIDNKENYGINKDNNFYYLTNKTKNNIYNNGSIFKNVFSPVNNNKNLQLTDKINYIYKKKSAQKIRNKFSENNIFNINSPTSYNISNFNAYETGNTKNTGVKKTKSCFSTKIHMQNMQNMQNQNQKSNQINNNINININNKDNSLINSLEEKQKLTDLDKNILEKGTSIRNDFQKQLNFSFNKTKYPLENTYDDIYNDSNRNSSKNIDDIYNIRYNRSQKEFHKINKNIVKSSSPKVKLDLDSSKNNNNNITPFSINHSNNMFTQEDLKNNIINLLDFYSLLKKKINNIKDNLYKNKHKLIIKKEKFNYQLKKNNRLTQKIISIESKIIMHANINCILNEQIILPLMKIKKIESTIYHKLFGLTFYDYDIIKFREKEKNKLFEEQNIMHLLLIIIKNMIEYYGNISHVYKDDINRKKMLNLLFMKYEIKEKNEINEKNNMNINNINQNVINNNFKNENKQLFPGQIIDDEFLNKFKIIREVEEDKEYDDSEEEEKYKKESKVENDIRSLDIEENNESNININEIKNEKEIENGASKNENERSNKKYNNKYINEINEEYNNKTDLINNFLFEKFPKKYPNEKPFIFKKNNEYIFGENTVNVEMHNNCLEFIINNKKYNLEDFLKFYSHNNNKCIITNEKNIEEQLNGIETTAVESDKSENIIKEKNGKINKNVSQNNNDEENNDNLNSLRKQKRIKRKISIENDEVEQVEQNNQELNKIKNGS